MLHSKRFFGLLVLAASCGFVMQTAACGDDVESADADSGSPDTSTAADTSVPDTSSPDAADAAKPAPVFLDPSDYTDLVAIDPSFPYGVTSKHKADSTIDFGAKWGAAGPIVTAFPRVTTWTLPSDPKGDATSVTVSAAVPTNLLGTPFYGGDGFVDLPFGPFALESYTTTATGNAPPPGEALLYAPTFGAVVSRAFANGFYSGVGLVDGATNTIIYSGDAPLSATKTAINDNGIYAAPLMAGGLDLYGLSKAQALSPTTVTQTTLGNDAAGFGTNTVAAIAEKGATDGWFVTIGYPDMTTGAVPPVRGVAYTSSAAGVATGAHAYAAVLTPTAAVTGLGLMSDNDGNLWLAVTTAGAGSFLELQKKP